MMWRWLTHNHQTLTAVGAMLVGIAALFVAWDQGRVMRAQQHGSVVPVLQIDGFIQSTPDVRNLGLRIVNHGVGPAMIERVSLMRDGEEQTDFSGLIERLPPGFDRSWSSANGRALAPGGEVEPVVFSWSRGELDHEPQRDDQVAAPEHPEARIGQGDDRALEPAPLLGGLRWFLGRFVLHLD